MTHTRAAIVLAVQVAAIAAVPYIWRWVWRKAGQ